MIELSQATPIDVETARRITADVAGFALQFYEDGSGEPRELDWVTRPDLVTRFVAAAGLGRAEPRSPTATLMQEAVLRDLRGHLYYFHLYKVQPSEAGLIVLADGSSTTTVDLHSVIVEAYALSRYSPREESRRIKLQPSVDGP